MTRYVIIALMNLAVIAAIAINADIALIRGCNMDGTCAGGSGPLTVGLGVGLTLMSVVGGALLARQIARSRIAPDNVDFAGLSVARPLRMRDVEAEAAAAAASAGEDEAMLSRLARMSHATVTPAPEPEPETITVAASDRRIDWAESDRPAGTPAPVADVAKPAPAPASVAEVAPPPPVPPRVAPDLHIVVAEDRRTSDRAGRRAGDAPTRLPGDDAGRYGWLFESDTGAAAVQVRRDAGFPWCVAAIDHICRGIEEFGPALADTDILPEASAWRRVTADLPRSHALTHDDAVAFTEWLNVGLKLVGRSGRMMIAMAMQRLEAEAAGDVAIARRLPRGISDDDARDEALPMVRYG